MIGEIAKFNYLRNELKVNRELEESMLVEEELEFKEAYTAYLNLIYVQTDALPTMKDEAILDCIVDMVDAYCDFNYVYYGSLLKFLGTGTIFDYTQKQTLMSTIVTEILINHGCKIHEQFKKPLLDKAMSFVIEANEVKPLKKTKGKVAKGKDFRDPKEDIKELILDRGFNPDMDDVINKIKKQLEDASKPVVPINMADLPDNEGA
jgi:hypothetical protein